MAGAMERYSRHRSTGSTMCEGETTSLSRDGETTSLSRDGGIISPSQMLFEFPLTSTLLYVPETLHHPYSHCSIFSVTLPIDIPFSGPLIHRYTMVVRIFRMVSVLSI
jgi:hypothetical protein